MTGKTLRTTFFQLFLSLSLFFSGSCAKDEAVYTKSKLLMDTIVTITVVSDSAGHAESAIADTFGTIQRFGDLIDFFSGGSEIASLNRNAGVRETRVSPETLAVIENALYIAEKSAGAFDPTIGPESRLWDFAAKKRPS